VCVIGLSCVVVLIVRYILSCSYFVFFFQAEDGIRDYKVTGVQTCALPIYNNCCVMVGTQNSGSFVLYSHPLYEYLRDSTPEFSELAAFEPWTSDLSVRRSGSAAEPYKGEFVSGNYFNTLGIRAFAGRLLTPSDDSVSAPRVAVMNYHTWQRHFGLDPSVIGSTLNINGVPCAIAGVTPPGFYGDTLRSDPADFWLPLVAEPNGRLHKANL